MVTSAAPNPARAQVQQPQFQNPADAARQEAERQRRQIEQQVRRGNPELSGPVIESERAPDADPVKPGGKTFKLRVIEFSKSHFLSREELGAIASKYQGKDVDLATLYKIVSDINAIYNERGL
ncbi:MAG: POTRA domain-containing protein, partial [Pseudomonadota bacterium]